jgi:tetratricopeptide (TPR) repeat protein
MARPVLSALAIVLVLAAAAPDPAGAVGGRRTLVPGDTDLDRAAALIEAERYADALDLLGRIVVREPDNADAYNYIGFAHRKLGRHDAALDNYARALALDPLHRGALEYQGEAFLELGDPAAAEANLATLRRACPEGCEELDELAAAIAAYHAAQADE